MLLVLKKYQSTTGGGWFKSTKNSANYNYQEIYEHLKIGEIQFLNCNEEEVLLSVIWKVTQAMSQKKTDNAMLSRIVRNGGICSYIEKLEALNGNA